MSERELGASKQNLLLGSERGALLGVWITLYAYLSSPCGRGCCAVLRSHESLLLDEHVQLHARMQLTNRHDSQEYLNVPAGCLLSKAVESSVVSSFIRNIPNSRLIPALALSSRSYSSQAGLACLLGHLNKVADGTDVVAIGAAKNERSWHRDYRRLGRRLGRCQQFGRGSVEMSR